MVPLPGTVFPFATRFQVKQPKGKTLLGIGTALIALGTIALVRIGHTQGQPTEVVVYKTPTCGCCAKWVEHARAHGFKSPRCMEPRCAVSAIRRGMAVSFRSSLDHIKRQGNFSRPEAHF